MAPSWSIFICFFLVLWSSGASVDLTLNEREKGAVVVRAVIEKISSFGLFSNCSWWDQGTSVDVKRCLRVAALALTEDGHRVTAPPEHSGGIWNIDMSVHHLSISHLNSTSMSDVKAEISKILPNILDFNDYTNLDKPIYSGLAAILRLHEFILSSNQCPTQGARAPIRSQSPFQEPYHIWNEAIDISDSLSSSEWNDASNRISNERKYSEWKMSCI